MGSAQATPSVRNWFVGAISLISRQAVDAVGSSAAADAEIGDDIVVTGSIYHGKVASGGARIDVPVNDLPLSISVVNEALTKDRQFLNLRGMVCLQPTPPKPLSGVALERTGTSSDRSR